MDIREFSKALYETLGEMGQEAVLDAINYYLLHNKDFPCEEDKLILLSILMDNCNYCMGYYKDHNALCNFVITFGGNDNVKGN